MITESLGRGTPPSRRRVQNVPTAGDGRNPLLFVRRPLFRRLPSLLKRADALLGVEVVHGSALSVLLGGEEEVLRPAEGEPARPCRECGEGPLVQRNSAAG